MFPVDKNPLIVEEVFASETEQERKQNLQAAMDRYIQLCLLREPGGEREVAET